MKSRSLIFLLAILLFPGSGVLLAQDKPSPTPPAPPSDMTPCTEVDIKGLNVPPDFFIVYRAGPTHGNRPGRRTHVAVDANGVVKYFVGSVSRTTGKPLELPLKQRKISKEKVKRVYARVVACGFFDLNKNYRNPRIRDGGYSHLSVTAAGKTHSVNVSHSSVRRFSSIMDTLGRETGVRLY
ncbi:MAG: hypothetical protein AB9866_19455 [Syntrophobacteraceae bacterium]